MRSILLTTLLAFAGVAGMLIAIVSRQDLVALGVLLAVTAIVYAVRRWMNEPAVLRQVGNLN